MAVWNAYSPSHPSPPPPHHLHLTPPRPPFLTLARQTVFYTPQTITLTEGDKIKGELTCSPNARNNRDLDIKIKYSTTGEPNEVTMDYKMCV